MKVATKMSGLARRTSGAPARRWRRVAVALGSVLVVCGAAICVWVLTRSTPATSSVAALGKRPAIAPTANALDTPTGPPRRVLVVGDSTAMTLEWALAQTASFYDASVFDGSTFMCGVAIGTEASSDNGNGPTLPMVPPCNSATPSSQQWPALWRVDVSEYDPQVVVVLAGRWETTDRMYDGRWSNILDRPFADYVERQLRLAVQIATSGGAHVDMLTTACADSAPYFAAEHQPDTAVADDSPTRLAVYNGLVRQAVRGARSASVVDFNALLCPGGTFHKYLDGVQVRPLDGVHTPSYAAGNPFISNSTPQVADAFATWLGPRLWPEILSGLGPG